MITLILLALLLTLIQLMTPALLNSKNLDFLISNRRARWKRHRLLDEQEEQVIIS